MDHGHGPGGDLFVALEQLEAIRDLLLANSPVKDRMALILLDALADALLFRRLEQIYEATEEPFLRHKMPRFSRQDTCFADSPRIRFPCIGAPFRCRGPGRSSAAGPFLNAR